jgi:hypothetical protein
MQNSSTRKMATAEDEETKADRINEFFERVLQSRSA